MQHNLEKQIQGPKLVSNSKDRPVCLQYKQNMRWFNTKSNKIVIENDLILPVSKIPTSLYQNDAFASIDADEINSQDGSCGFFNVCEWYNHPSHRWGYLLLFAGLMSPVIHGLKVINNVPTCGRTNLI